MTLNYDYQEPFAGIEIAQNPEPRCPCILLLDTSGSMSGPAINQLNEGIRTFKDDLIADPLSSLRVEVAIVTFGPVQVVTDFTTAERFSPPVLTASGDTPMGAAIGRALTLLRERKDFLESHGIQRFRPWIFLVTDGSPTDEWSHIPALVKEGEEKGAFSFFALAVSGADFETLRQISLREPIALSGVKFREFFLWLSASLKGVSRSAPGEKVALPDYKPYGWAEV